MGKESTCSVRLDGLALTCKVKLETDFIQLSGDANVKVLLSALSSVETDEGWLELRWPEHQLSVQLGSQVDRWVKAILDPPSLLVKLGLKSGMSVVLLNCNDPTFMSGQPFLVSIPKGPVDVVLLFAETLEQLSPLRGQVLQGALWIVYPRGVKAITELQVIEFGRSLGLADVKVCRFSEAQTALKFVHRRA